ncbi:MAG: MqnA/MqnD/SBP family protein [Chloroflexota bacterium]
MNDTALLPIQIQQDLMLAPYWMAARDGWIDDTSNISLIAASNPKQLANSHGIVMTDALVASRLLDRWSIVADHGAVWRRNSMLTMVTHDRPDNVEEAIASVHSVSITGRALAQAVIPEFYGISVSEWTDEDRNPDPETIRVTEGSDALLPGEDDRFYHEDLGRAWFLMTDSAFVSNVCLVRNDSLQDAPERVVRALDQLSRLLDGADEHRRELRRNISRDHDIDRELVVDILDELTTSLDDNAIEGLRTLYIRSGVWSQSALLPIVRRSDIR